GYLDHPALKARKKLVRAHNIEWQYYKNLQQLERALIPKLYAALEWRKLIKWDQKLRLADHLLTISKRDQSHYSQLNPRAQLIFPFHGNAQTAHRFEAEPYVLFHGDLSIGDNVAVAQFLIDQLKDGDYELVLAGRAPKKELRQRIQKVEKVRLVANPDGAAMKALIQKAKVNVLWSFQTAGMKLKLVNALFQGRFIVANEHILNGTPVEETCLKANSPIELREQITYSMQHSWTKEMQEKRNNLLRDQFDDRANAFKIKNLL
ncbi:MAG: glycosyltransferase family 4 protein, partial [Bacteroidota bacterium]